MPWAGNIAKTMTSNGKQFTVTREMLTAVAGISARFSKFAFVLFCYITNHLMTGPLGNSEFCFPRISMFPSTSSRETLRFLGNKIHCSPRVQSLSVKYDIFTCEDIDDFSDINFVSLIVLKFVGVSSKHLRIFLESLRESSEIFGHLREFSEIRGKCSGTFVWPSEQFWKIFGNLRKIVKNAVISKFI